MSSGRRGARHAEALRHVHDSRVETIFLTQADESADVADAAFGGAVDPVRHAQNAVRFAQLRIALDALHGVETVVRVRSLDVAHRVHAAVRRNAQGHAVEENLPRLESRARAELEHLTRGLDHFVGRLERTFGSDQEAHGAEWVRAAQLQHRPVLVLLHVGDRVEQWRDLGV